jgi:hypothetical protein
MDNSKLPRDIAETFLQIGAIFLLMIVAVIVYLAIR